MSVVGTRFKLDLPPLTEQEAAACGLAAGDPNPFALVEVVGVANTGEQGFVPIIAPVTFSSWSSPKMIELETLDELGYEIVELGEKPEGWVTPDEELVPEYGQPGWTAAIAKRDAEAKAALEAAA